MLNYQVVTRIIFHGNFDIWGYLTRDITSHSGESNRGRLLLLTQAAETPDSGHPRLAMVHLAITLIVILTGAKLLNVGNEGMIHNSYE